MLRIGWQGLRASRTLRFCWPRLSTLPTAGHVLFAHAHNLLQYVGKGRLLYKRMLAAASAAFISMYVDADADATRAGYVLYRALVLFMYTYS